MRMIGGPVGDGVLMSEFFRDFGEGVAQNLPAWCVNVAAAVIDQANQLLALIQRVRGTSR